MGSVVALPKEKPAKVKPEHLKFTEQRVTGLALPAAGSRYVYDTEEPGLCVRLTPSHVAYVFYRWHRGRPGRITIGKVEAVTLRDARHIAAGHRGDLARGKDVFAEARKPKDGDKPKTLQGAFDAHISRPDMRKSTHDDYTSLWRLVPARLKSRPIGEVSEADITKLHNTVGAEHTRTANKVVALLSVLFNRNGRRKDNPVADVERFRQSPRARVLTGDEMYRLRQALTCEKEPWQSYFLLAMLTGARRGALARMRWNDVDLDGATWRIPAEWSKNRRMLTVALATEAVTVLSVLHDQRGSAPWVFPSSTSKSGHLVEPKKAWRRTLQRAGIEGAVLHDLRRTLGTTVAAEGAGAAVISAVLGHLSMESAKSYLHLSAEMARPAIERAARRTARQPDATGAEDAPNAV